MRSKRSTNGDYHFALTVLRSKSSSFCQVSLICSLIDLLHRNLIVPSNLSIHQVTAKDVAGIPTAELKTEVNKVSFLFQVSTRYRLILSRIFSEYYWWFQTTEVLLCYSSEVVGARETRREVSWTAIIGSRRQR